MEFSYTCDILLSPLDNVYRGNCKHCNQNYLRYDRESKKFYCGNRSCNKLYEGIIKNSRLKDEFEKSSGLVCQQADISQASNPKVVLNYMLKYITEAKDAFSSIESYCLHLSKTYKFRQITTTGIFYNYKSKHIHIQFHSVCPKCRQIIRFDRDMEVIALYLEQKRRPPPAQQILD